MLCASPTRYVTLPNATNIPTFFRPCCNRVVAHYFIENTSTVCTETLKFLNVAENTLTQFENDMRKYADTTNVNLEKKFSNKYINYFWKTIYRRRNPKLIKKAKKQLMAALQPRREIVINCYSAHMCTMVEI